MEMITNEKINFNSLEEKTYKKMMELGRNIIRDELRLVDDLIKKYRDKEVFKVKDMQLTTIKTKLGDIAFSRRRSKKQVKFGLLGLLKKIRYSKLITVRSKKIGSKNILVIKNIEI